MRRFGRRTIVCGCLLAVALSGTAPAMAQNENGGAESTVGVAGMRCSELATLDAAAQPGAIYYIAGYADGQRDATTFATVGGDESASEPADQSRESAGEGIAAETNAAEAELAAEESPVATGLVPTLSVEQIAAACAQSPDSRVADIITSQGGAIRQ